MPPAIGSAFPRNRKYSPSFLPPQKTTSCYYPAILSLSSRYLPVDLTPTTTLFLR